ncbi:hypothetical protein GCM10028805_38050 [Spirosoma harenae]
MRPPSLEVRKQLAHGLAGVIIMIKGIDKAEHHHTIAGGILIAFGLFVFVLTIFHHRLARYIKSFDSLVFFVEAIVLGIVSVLYFQDGKKALPIAYGLATIGYLIAAFRLYRRTGQHSH